MARWLAWLAVVIVAGCAKFGYEEISLAGDTGVGDAGPIGGGASAHGPGGGAAGAAAGGVGAAGASGGAAGAGQCGVDWDADRVCEDVDNCPSVRNEDQADTDGDGAGNACDECPADVAKVSAGACGCGVSDADSDGDLTVDCNDGCPSDASKAGPGICGCGVSDADSDGDLTVDCNDGCPSDASKTAPGICGCGVSDADSDGDLTVDCNDGCPSDASKTGPGICGCGVSDADSDGDLTVDCNDGCPSDASKAAPGICGCGVSDADSDGDLTVDCNDGCPSDASKTAPGICGCGVSDADSDGDLTVDCNDGCPSDASKTAPGICGCGVSDADSDGDLTVDCNDGCPSDASKAGPGICGCGVSDADSDGDLTVDCNDGCPSDASKTAPGICGCGDADSDGDGVCDSVDLDLQGTLPSARQPVVSGDESSLFVIKDDRSGLAAYDISTGALAAAPVWLADEGVLAAEEAGQLMRLSDGRLALTSRPTGTLDANRIRVYSFDGTGFVLEEDIFTTDVRIYDVAYDPLTDRLYWTNFHATQSLRYYVLGSVSLGHTGPGEALGTWEQQGTYALFVDGSDLYRFKGVVDLVDPTTGALLHSIPTDGSHVHPGHNNVARFGNYLLYVERYFDPMHFTAVDVSTPTAAFIANALELSQGAGSVVTRFALREAAGVAIAADEVSGIHIVDLSGLPTSLPRLEQLGPAELGGLTPRGNIDCTDLCCYADATSGVVIRLCP